MGLLCAIPLISVETIWVFLFALSGSYILMCNGDFNQSCIGGVEKIQVQKVISSPHGLKLIILKNLLFEEKFFPHKIRKNKQLTTFEELNIASSQK